MTPYSIPIYRVTLVRDSVQAGPRRAVTESWSAAGVLRDYLDGADREHCVVLMLDQKRRMIGINTVSTGSLTDSIVHPREAFKPAILCNAAAIIVGHNHPSGDPEPSPEDIELTTRLVAAGKILGIQVLDHIIIGETRHISLADTGRM